ncbi:hypothetical protein AMS68_007238 [Peltaster fructicola]|uniref:Heterokaryon incompatibility domain-containing protein n=1 Tax=Peltaster fructicola TaxID=286661 RepID=A0A6H0Y478_9PEZI|nr:hypothetical protein AMS68_007238 [Peltaster fructicola]
MTDVYAKSSAVLVIDKMVSETSWNFGWPASLWQVSQSNWSRRLWTLQEGVLNPYTFFAMLEGYDTLEGWIVSNHQSRVLLEPLRKYRDYLNADGNEGIFIAPDELLAVEHRILYDKRSPHHLQSPALLDPVYRTICHRILQTRRVMQSHGGPVDAGRLFQSAAWRNVTYTSDEAICLAILTKRGTIVLEGLSDPDQRIAAIIRELDNIPAHIVFIADNKMTLPGCRWMSKSFLNTRMNFDNPSGELGVPTDKGLRIRLQAVRAIRGSTITFTESYEALVSQYTMTLRFWDMRVIYRSNTPVLQCLGDFLVENGVMLLEARLTEAIATCGAIIAIRTHIEDSIQYLVPVHYGAVYLPETMQGLRPHVGPIADPDEVQNLGLDSRSTTPALSGIQRLAPKIKVDVEDLGLCEVCLT